MGADIQEKGPAFFGKAMSPAHGEKRPGTGQCRLGPAPGLTRDILTPADVARGVVRGVEGGAQGDVQVDGLSGAQQLLGALKCACAAMVTGLSGLGPL